MRRARCGRMARARISVSVHLRARAPRRMREKTHLAEYHTQHTPRDSAARKRSERKREQDRFAQQQADNETSSPSGSNASPTPPRPTRPQTQSGGQAAWPAPRREMRFAVCRYTFFSMMVLMTSDARSHASQHASMLSNSFDHTSTRMGFSRSSTCSWRMTLM